MMNHKMDAPITALALAKMARQLLDLQNVGASDDSPVANNVDRDQQWFRAGFTTGITTMCMTAMEAIPTTPGEVQPPFPVHGNDQLILSEIPWDVVRIGERKAGTLIDIESGVIYDLVLMPDELDDVTWEEATAKLAAAGGALPSHYEMLVLSKFLGSGTFENDAYWTNVKIKFGDDACESVSYFHDGSSDFTDLSDQMSARGVRRVPVGDASEGDGAPARTVVVNPPKDGSNLKVSPVVEGDDGGAGNVAPAARAEAVLRKLDGYMASNGYGVDHPWRSEIAAALPQASTGQSWGLAQAPAAGAPPAPAIPHGEYRLTDDKMNKLVMMQRRACDLLEAAGAPVLIEAAGDLRSATGDLWDAVVEQLTINELPPTLSDWMTTPAGLMRVLVGALRAERIGGNQEYNEGVQVCIDVVTALISDGAVADKGIDAANLSSSASDFRTDQQQKWAELSAMAPKVPVDDVADVLAQLQAIGAADGQVKVVRDVCSAARAVIEGLLPHAGAGVEA